jgi:hypothetical protein
MLKNYSFQVGRNEINYEANPVDGGQPPMIRQARRQKERKLRKIKIVPTDFKLTTAGGLGTVLEIFDQTPLAAEFKGCLPERNSHRSSGSYLMALMVMAGHIHGVEALADLWKIQSDPYLQAMFEDEVAAIRTIGDFLRDFDETHIMKLNSFLNRMSRSLMSSLAVSLEDQYKPKDLLIDMDSTYHEHFGEKIEGVAWNYKNEWSIETQVSFNSLGFCHGLQMRPGNTKSGTDAAPMIEKLFLDSRTQRVRRLEGKDFFRADSAYCYQDVIRSLMKVGAAFTLTANDATTKWKSQLEEEGMAWEPWIHSEEAVKRAATREEELPRTEVARMHWQPGWSKETLLFPIVVKRTWVPIRESGKSQGDLFAPDTIKAKGEWDYYAVVTNFNLNDWSLQSVMEHHAKRGNAENFVKEEKYNFKLKNFPCQKLLANHAWVLLAQVAHNMIRWIAIMDQPSKPHYSKKIRNKYVFISGRVVSHAGSIILRVMKSAYERGLRDLRESWQFSATMSAQMSSAPSG